MSLRGPTLNQLLATVYRLGRQHGSGLTTLAPSACEPVHTPFFRLTGTREGQFILDYKESESLETSEEIIQERGRLFTK